MSGDTKVISFEDSVQSESRLKCECLFTSEIIQGGNALLNEMRVFDIEKELCIARMTMISYMCGEDDARMQEMLLGVSRGAFELNKKFQTINEQVMIRNPKVDENLIVNQVEDIELIKGYDLKTVLNYVLKGYKDFMELEGKDILLIDVDAFCDDLNSNGIDRGMMLNILEEAGYLINIVSDGNEMMQIVINELGEY